MKTCFKCQRAKPEDEFYRHPEMGDGRLGKCKECTKADSRATRRRRYGYYKEYDHDRNKLPHRIMARKVYSKTRRGREAARKGRSQWHARNPHKRKAQIALNNAVRDGKVLRMPCQECGDSNSHGHHYDYSKPLDVLWLCPQHHSDEHHKTREAEAA